MIKFCESKKLWLRELFVLVTFRYSAMQASSSSDYVNQLANSKEVEQMADKVIEANWKYFIKKKLGSEI